MRRAPARKRTVKVNNHDKVSTIEIYTTFTLTQAKPLTTHKNFGEIPQKYHLTYPAIRTSVHSIIQRLVVHPLYSPLRKLLKFKMHSKLTAEKNRLHLYKTQRRHVKSYTPAEEMRCIRPYVFSGQWPARPTERRDRDGYQTCSFLLHRCRSSSC